jgi:hypothetical protein
MLIGAVAHPVLCLEVKLRSFLLASMLRISGAITSLPRINLWHAEHLSFKNKK